MALIRFPCVVGRRDRDTKKSGYNFGAVFTLPDPKTLPFEFALEPLEIMNQRDSDFCGPHAGSAASELQEGVLLEPSWLMQKTKQIMGDVQGYGVSPEALAQAMLTGGLEKKDSPYSLDTYPPEFLRDPMNWGPKYEEHIEAVGPETILASRDRSHELFQLFEIFCRLLVVAQLGHTLLTVLRLGTTHDHTAQVLKSVFLVLVEKRDLDLLAPPLPTDLHRNGEIGLHAIGRETILVEKCPFYTLPNPLLGRILDLTSCYIIRDRAFGH